MRASFVPPCLAVIGAVVLALAAAAPGATSPRVASAAVCSPVPHAPGEVARTIVSGGATRTYQLHVPPSYDGVTPLPLVLNYHGLGSNISQQINVSDLYPRADAQGFFVATPQGLPTSGWPANHWNILMSPGPSNYDDVLFSSNIIDDVAAQVCVDVAHVYATGMSNGAEMSVRLGCSLSARIAAIAPVAGSYYPPLTPVVPSEPCPDTRPMPVIAFHGTGDMTIPFNGGAGLNGILFRDIDDVVIPAWATHNGCTVGPTTSLAAPGINLIEYSGCADAATVQLYAVFDYDGDGPATTGGGHIWPGSPYVPSGSTNAIEATDLMLAFFSQFSVPCAGGDTDCDSVADANDNCVSAYNPGQQNSDGNFLNLHPTKSFDDLSQPNSDLVGDSCDLDDDNDGRSDADEIGGVLCGGAVTNPLDADTDGDNYLDGAECNAVPNTNPTLIASKPTNEQCGLSTDADADGLPAFREVCFYNTDPNNPNTDSDACRDGREVASNNATNSVDVLDLYGVAQEAGTYTLPGSAVKVDFDATKNGSIDVVDLAFVASQAGSCP